MSRLTTKLIINPLTFKGSLNEAIAEVRRSMIFASNEKCWRCGKVKKKLHMHHINGCALDWRKENLLLVCPKCHKEVQGRKIYTTSKLNKIRTYVSAERLATQIPGLTVEEIAHNLAFAEKERRGK